MADETTGEESTDDTGAPDTGGADTGAPDTGAADTGAADTGGADTGAADIGGADTGGADTGGADGDGADGDGVNEAGWWVSHNDPGHNDPGQNEPGKNDAGHDDPGEGGPDSGGRDSGGRAAGPPPPTIDAGFSTWPMTALLSDANRVAAMCDVEGALAQAQADAGLIDRDVADRIAEACAEPIEAPARLLGDGWRVGTPVLPLLDTLRGRLDTEAAAALHHGATSQDIVDTATMLLTRDALRDIREDVDDMVLRLLIVARDQADEPTDGWTFLQRARPTTVGRRAAGWLSPMTRHMADLRTTAAGLPVQLGGPVGTLDGFGDAGPAVTEALAERLGLAVPPLPWHTDRTPILDVAGLLARLTRTTGTIASDLALLAHHGLADLPSGGSSSMPGKRNPVDAIQSLAAADACAAVTAGLLTARPHELERGVGAWHAEWFTLPLALHTAAAAVGTLCHGLGFGEITGGASGALGTLPAGATPAAQAQIASVVAAAEKELRR